MKKFLKTLIYLLPLLIIIAGCDLPFGNDDDDDKNSTTSVEGTWIKTNNTGNNSLKRILSGTSYYYLELTYNTTQTNTYTESECYGTFSTNTSSSPKTITITYNRIRTRVTTNGTTADWSSWTTITNDVATRYYKLENNYWYTVPTSDYDASWSKAQIFRKQ